MTDGEAARALLESQHTLVLATVGEDGAPRSAPLYYIPGTGFRLYWMSSPRSAHSRALKRGASVSIFAPSEHWRAIRGLQMWGEARAVRGLREKAQVLERYRRHFGLGAEFAPLLSRTRLYVFEPRRVRYIDNSRGFGHKAEIELGQREQPPGRGK